MRFKILIFSAPLLFGVGVLLGQEPAPNEKLLVKVTEPAQRLHRNALVIDGHNDLPLQLLKRNDLSFQVYDLARVQRRLHTDIPRLRQGGVGAQFWSIYISPESVGNRKAVKEANEMIDLVHRLSERYPKTFAMAINAEDIVRIHSQGKIACMIGIQGGDAIDNSLAILRMYHRAGVRSMTLGNTNNTSLADSATDRPRYQGLSSFGEKVVLEMNRLGMIVDLSHASADTMRHALQLSRAPVMFSHSGAYALAPHPRNVPDDVLRMVAKNNGIVMVNFFPAFLTADGVRAYQQRNAAATRLRASFQNDNDFQVALGSWLKERPLPPTSVKNVVDHIDHIVKVAGINHVGIGSNFDGMVSVPRQLEDVSCFPIITQELLNRGYDEESIRKILGGNMLRVLRETEQVAGGVGANGD